MPDPLVETKLLVPRPRARAVPRRRLDELLGSRFDCDPDAGLGTGRVRQDHDAGQLAGSRRARCGSTAWVSLDERDRDPSSFWTYVLLAVDRAAPECAAAALGQLQSAQVPIDVVLTAMLNELSVRSDDLTLVLDDYHLAEGPDIQPGMVFLLDHLPPQVHRRHQHPGRPRPAAGPAAGPGGAGRGPRRGPAVHRGRGDRLPQRRQHPRPGAGRRRHPGEPHRGMGGGPAARGAVAAGPGRRVAVHRRVLRR